MTGEVTGVPPSGIASTSEETSSLQSSKPVKVSSLSAAPVEGRPVEGKIAKEIGTGDAAKDSFVYLTIKWSFLIGSLSTAAIFAKSFFDCDASGVNSAVEVVKSIWSVFMPVITLALGYAFGKGR